MFLIRKWGVVVIVFMAVSAAAAGSSSAMVSAKILAEGDEYWANNFGNFYTNGTIRAVALSGTEIYVGGNFTEAGGIAANRIARWDGSAWSALGSGLNGGVMAIAVSHPYVFVGGSFTEAGGNPAAFIARWDTQTSTWSALGSGLNNWVSAIAISGSDVYVGGGFFSAGGSPAAFIAKWSTQTSAWSTLGAGVNNSVRAISINGSDVYVGGTFTQAGGSPANYIAKWSAGTWSALGNGTNNFVNTIAATNAFIFAGGNFTQAGTITTNYVARWDTGARTWLGMSGGVDDFVQTIVVAGSNVYVGGNFTQAGGNPAYHIAKWVTGSWTSLGTGPGDGTNDIVYAIAADGPEIYVGGKFTRAGFFQANGIAFWNGILWIPGANGLNHRVRALAVSANVIYVGGSFSQAGGHTMAFIAKWDGTAWHELDGGMNNDVSAIAVSGPNVYVGGSFSEAGGIPANRVAMWNGSSWSALGGGLNGNASAIAVSGSDVYVGGTFTQAGGIPANSIAKWNGSSWSALGGGLNGAVAAIAVSGSDVYVGGTFSQAGGIPANFIARWNGSSWSALSTGTNHRVRAIAANATGVYVGGDFTSAGGIVVNKIARWNGNAWSALGTGISNKPDDFVGSITVSGSNVYVGGHFGNNIARWNINQNAWSVLGSGVGGFMDNFVFAIAVSGSNVYAGGWFETAGGKPSFHIGKWKTSDSFEISGRVTHDGNSLPNAVISNLPGNPVTNETGRYLATVDSGWSGTATPTLAGYSFTPASRIYADVTSNQWVQDYAAALVPPQIGLNRNKLKFGATVGGTVTQPQIVLITNVGGGALDWTAVGGAAWLKVTPASGTGNAVVTASVDHAGLGAGTHTAVITVSSTTAVNSPQTVNVTLEVIAAGASSPPFGFFDTPTDGAVVAGAIPVTGWALDDIQVRCVEIKRSPHATDDPAAIGPDGLVYIGDAVFVEGARPDIEATYPDYPLNYRAGWGYMMLTNFLPNQGNGPFTIHAFVYDTEGARVKLGQKTIAGDNANSELPFGTIDTPTQGGSASGAVFYNFGWALTPQPNMIPIDGSTIQVFVDGALLGNPSYNHYRQDVAEAFPGLKNTDGAVGVYTLDTTTYANGVHTIAWGVTDDAGNSDGIGSRYFMVQNTGGAEIEGAAVAAGPSGMRRPLSDIGHILTAFHEPVYASKGYDLTCVAEMVQTGADGAVEIAIAEVERVELVLGREAMERAVDSGRWSGRGSGMMRETPSPAETGPLSYKGYLVAGDELRPLPIGSTLNPRTGVFTWQPGPGFLGEYTFVFVRERSGGMQDKSVVRITIKPKF